MVIGGTAVCPLLTHSTVVSLESRVALLVGEVGGEQDAEGVSRGGDDLLTGHRLRVRLLPATEQRQHLPLRLHLQIQQPGVTLFMKNHLKLIKHCRQGNNVESSGQ